MYENYSHYTSVGHTQIPASWRFGGIEPHRTDIYIFLCAETKRRIHSNSHAIKYTSMHVKYRMYILPPPPPTEEVLVTEKQFT